VVWCSEHAFVAGEAVHGVARGSGQEECYWREAGAMEELAAAPIQTIGAWQSSAFGNGNAGSIYQHCPG
jgi:hypothetical protein